MDKTRKQPDTQAQSALPSASALVPAPAPIELQSVFAGSPETTFLDVSIDSTTSSEGVQEMLGELSPESTQTKMASKSPARRRIAGNRPPPSTSQRSLRDHADASFNRRAILTISENDAISYDDDEMDLEFQARMGTLEAERTLGCRLPIRLRQLVSVVPLLEGIQHIRDHPADEVTRRCGSL